MKQYKSTVQKTHNYNLHRVTARLLSSTEKKELFKKPRSL